MYSLYIWGCIYITKHEYLYRKLPNLRVYHTFFKLDILYFMKNTMAICPFDWYQWVYLAHRLYVHFQQYTIVEMACATVKKHMTRSNQSDSTSPATGNRIRPSPQENYRWMYIVTKTLYFSRKVSNIGKSKYLIVTITVYRSYKS